MTSQSDTKLLRIGEAAELVDKCPQTLRNWEKQGYITPHRKKNGHRRYTIEQLQPFLSPENEIGRDLTIYPQEPDVPVTIDDNKHPMLSIKDYEDKRLIPVKSQIKALEHTISYFQDREGLLLLIVNMLLLIVIRLLYLANTPTNLVMNATLLHGEYTDYISTLEEKDNPDTRIVEDSEEQKQSKEIAPDPIAIVKAVKPRKEDTIWEKAKKHASKVFFALSKASVDQSLDEEERKRANNVVKKILGPYQRATSNLSEYEPGTVNHDVAALLLFHQPTDFGIHRDRWSVRTLSKICKTNLETSACSRSQVHRVLQQLRWNCAKRPKMMSPDENYGQIMKRLGLLMCDLKENDLILFGDEFVYSTVKVAEYKKEKTAPEGLNEAPPFSLSKPFYRSVASILVNGLVDPRNHRLTTNHMEKKDYDTFFMSLCSMVDHYRSTLSEKSTIYIVLDNARYHCPEVLRKQVLEKYGDRVKVTFLPTYSPHHNPIERIWQFLLRNSRRCGENEKELWTELQDAVERYQEMGSLEPKPLQLHCDICGHKWQFKQGDDQESNRQSLEKHICFKIEGINPFNIHVLKHSVEHLTTDDFSYPFT